MDRICELIDKRILEIQTLRLDNDVARIEELVKLKEKIVKDRVDIEELKSLIDEVERLRQSAKGDKWYQHGREDMKKECIEAVKQYFTELIDKNPQWKNGSIDDYALIPNKEICSRLKELN